MKWISEFQKSIVALALLLATWAAHGNECPVRVGEYSGTVKAEWLTKTREMKLLEPFAFKGPDCKVWPVPKDAIVDGASIPKVFWSLIGGPFEGRYRDASVVHDYYCKVRTEPWEEVHEMFYHAMLANGVDSSKAGAMFYAVRWFGPKWQLVRSLSSVGSTDFGTATGTTSTVRVISIEDMKLSRDVVSVMASTAGQPTPFVTGGIASASFKNRIDTQHAPNSKWLIKNGIEVAKPPSTGTDVTAYLRATKTSVTEVAAPNSDFKFRLLSYGPSQLPTQAEVERLTAWIERDRPSLADLKNTPIDKVPQAGK